MGAWSLRLEPSEGRRQLRAQRRLGWPCVGLRWPCACLLAVCVSIGRVHVSIGRVRVSWLCASEALDACECVVARSLYSTEQCLVELDRPHLQSSVAASALSSEQGRAPRAGLWVMGDG